jgi:redox-sensing transcriptional repressor
VEDISSPKIAKELGYSEEQIRKDLQAVSDEAGRPKKGRNIQQLIDTLESFLRLPRFDDRRGHRNRPSWVALSSIIRISKEMGLSILAGFDVDPNKIGTTIGGKEIFPSTNYRISSPGSTPTS